MDTLDTAAPAKLLTPLQRVELDFSALGLGRETLGIHFVEDIKYYCSHKNKSPLTLIGCSNILVYIEKNIKNSHTVLLKEKIMNTLF
jgi:hypothetical protein